jgi:hypothetical protein
MTYRIEKTQQIQDEIKTIYYQGEHKWTTVFEDRKVYSDESESSSDLYFFGGTIVSD